MSTETELLFDRKTRIIATLGPASSDPDMVEKLIQAGVNIIRLNMSHGTHEHHRQSYQTVRKVAARLHRHVAIFCDLCGPKIRVGKLYNGEMELKNRAVVTVTTRKVERVEGVIPCQYPSLHRDVKTGDRLLLDDGKLELKVLEIKKQDIECRVIYGGVLTDKKGINLPDSSVSSPALTAQDKKDVDLALELGADLIALSFVRDAEDIKVLKRYMKRSKKQLPVISKIEKPEALNNFEAILEESDAVMVARGDLGVEIDAAHVPLVQKDLIRRARIACTPVIVATHMMESMIQNSRPTRAEVGDVSNAVLNGADAVMLSGETSVGRYPVQAVRQMRHILLEMEKWQKQNPESLHKINMLNRVSIRRALGHAAVSMTEDLDLASLLVPTTTGATAGVVSAFRPMAPIIGICETEAVARLLMMHWGVVPIVLPLQDIQDWQKMTRVISRKLKIKIKSRNVLIIAGFGSHTKRDQPVLKLVSF